MAFEQLGLNMLPILGCRPRAVRRHPKLATLALVAWLEVLFANIDEPGRQARRVEVRLLYIINYEFIAEHSPSQCVGLGPQQNVELN